MPALRVSRDRTVTRRFVLVALGLPVLGLALLAKSPLPRFVAVSRQLLLVGPETVPFADGRPRAARVLAELKERGARVVARAGDSIELFELPAPR